MRSQFSRTEMLLGSEGMKKLFSARVAVFGVGGVGGYTVEALARSGVGTLDLIDDDRVSLTNLNRQILATHQTIGRYKVDVAAERIRSINPDAVVNTYKMFYLPETAGLFDFSQYDYVVDAIDTVSGKIALVMQAEEAGTPIISCMGAGNKVDASAFEVADIYETSVCPLARVMRRELKKRGVRKLKVVYSREPVKEPTRTGDMVHAEVPERKNGTEFVNVPKSMGDMAHAEVPNSALGIEDSGRSDGIRPTGAMSTDSQRRQVPGSTAFVPAAAGLIIAGEVVRDITATPVGKRPSSV